jgi:DNA-binding NarL/FixJ family response regulator
MRIFIADADADIRVAVQMLANQQPDMNVVGIAVQCDNLVEQVRLAKPDILHLNWELPGQDVTEKVKVLCEAIPRLKLIVLSVRPEARSPALAAGADAFIDMAMTSDALIDTYRRVAKCPVALQNSA